MLFAPSQSLIWALGFANAPLLWGLAAASVPILIHLLNRRRFRETTWAAMQFLMAAIRKNQRRVKIEQWLLLAVRTLLILLIVAAMAKPFLESFGNVIAGRRTHRLLVIDGSLSMGYKTGDKSRFDEAKAVAQQFVRDSRRGDAISLIMMGEPPRVVIGDPSPNLAEVQKEIAELSLPHGGTDLQATFEAIDRVLDVSSIGQKEIVFLTDLQRASWRRPAASGKDSLDTLLAKIESRRPRSVVIDLGRPDSENRALTNLRVDAPVVTTGAPVLVRGLIHNFGPSRADGVLVRLTVNGRLGPEQSVDLPVGEDVPVVFNQQFSTPGDRVVEMSMDNDPLALDDHRFLVLPVRESLNVLLVDGDFKSEPFQAETDYLAQALAPSEGSPGQPGMIRVEVVAESQLSRRDLGGFDVVALCNVAQFSPGEVTALEEFLKQGGGLVVFGGNQVIAENYNRLLYADGKGLLPAAVGPAVGDAAKRETAFGFNPLGFRHPLVDAFRGESDSVKAGLTQALTLQYHKLVLPKDSDAQVALAFETGDPAVIEAPRRRGKVIQVATSADAGWTTWPLHNSYLADHAADDPAGGRGTAGGTQHPGGPALRPVVRRGGRVGHRHGDHPQGTTGRGQAQEQRRGQPASFRADRVIGAVPGSDRFPPDAGDRVRRQPRSRRKRSGKARSHRAGGAPARLELRLLDQLARIEHELRFRGPARRIASPITLHGAPAPASGIVPGLEIRPPRFLFLRIADCDGLDPAIPGRSIGREASPGRRGDHAANPAGTTVDAMAIAGGRAGKRGSGHLALPPGRKGLSPL